MTNDQETGDDLDLMGPIDYIVVEFPGSRMTGEGFPILLDLVDRGLIRILDLAFVMKDEDGTIHAIDISDVDGERGGVLVIRKIIDTSRPG